MKKNRKLSAYHKSNRKFLHVIPVFSIAAIIMGTIEVIKYPQLQSYGLSLIGIGGFFIIVYFIALTFTNYYIKKLEKEEAAEEEKLRKLEQAESEKDEKIKELEEELNKMKNDDHSDA